VRFLLRNGCNAAQGFYFSHAVSAQEIIDRYGSPAESSETAQSARA
jgi:hypothetical protein